MGARLEKVGQVWRQVKPYLLGVLVVSVVAGAIWALIYVPKMQVPVCPPGPEGLPPKICFDIENEARRTLAYILAGILAIIGIYMGHRRIRALERQVQVAQEGQITDRFTRAIEQLGSDKMEVRLGGIYALERIAKDSDKDYWPIMETLTAYVRENAPWRDQTQDEKGKAAGAVAPGQETPTPAPAATLKPATDIQAILTVLSRRKYQYGQRENQPLDLRNTDLRGGDLRGARLEGADLSGAHMERAVLEYASLEWANFEGTYLQKAFLAEARMENASFEEAHMEGASLNGAHLEEASLMGARLEGTKLLGTYLERTTLKRAHLEGADLRWAEGLTQEQLAGAFLDEKTILPDYLQEKPRGDKGPEGNNEG